MSKKRPSASPRSAMRQWMLNTLSIRQRLALWYATLLAITLVLFSVIVYTVAQNQLQSNVRDEVKRDAISIAGALKGEYAVSNPETPTPSATTKPTATPTTVPPTTGSTTPSETVTPTPIATPDQATSQQINRRIVIDVPEALNSFDLGFEVFDRKQRLLSNSPTLNADNLLSIPPDVFNSVMLGAPQSYTERSGSSLLAVYVEPITFVPPSDDDNATATASATVSPGASATATSASKNSKDGDATATPGDSTAAAQIIGVVLVAKSLDGVNDSLSTLSRLLIIGDLIALLFASAGGWLIAESGLRPIAAVTRAARTIAHNAAGANLGTRVDYKGPQDEVGELVSTFNDMLAAIERVATAQRRFVADASHELRAPLTTIKGSLDFLRRAPDLSEPERRATIEDAYTEADRMASLVNDLLLLARVDAAASGKYGLPESWLDEQLRTRREPLQLDELAMDIFRHGMAQMRARGKDLRLSVSNIEPVTVVADPGQIRQLVTILLDNAIKYTPAGGKVRISVTRNGDRAAFSITDTGIGIQPEDRPHIFERFYRADQARERDEHGGGLGLAIAKWIADAHHGDIAVNSQPGQGSTFTVLLPAMPLSSTSGERSATPQPTRDEGREPPRSTPLGIGRPISSVARLARSAVSGPRGKPTTHGKGTGKATTGAGSTNGSTKREKPTATTTTTAAQETKAARRKATRGSAGVNTSGSSGKGRPSPPAPLP